MLFTQKLAGYFFNNFSNGSKSYHGVCTKLSGLRWVYHHVIYTKVNGYIVNSFFLLVKVTVVFIPKLSGLRGVCYHAIYT